jgi:hypothetical protein
MSKPLFLREGFYEGSAPRRVYQFGNDIRFACSFEFNASRLQGYNLMPGADTQRDRSKVQRGAAKLQQPRFLVAFRG